MSLIKCPDCGKEVSDKSEVCIHCGCPLNQVKTQRIIVEKAKENKSEWPKPNPDQTVFNSFKNRKRNLLIIWSIISLICLIVSLVILIPKKASFGLLIIIIMLDFAVLFVLLVTAIGVKIVIREKDGYSIVLYAGWFFHVLCIDSKVVSKTLSRNLYGTLPNGKSVWAEVSFWDNSPKIGIGSDGDEKQFI